LYPGIGLRTDEFEGFQMFLVQKNIAVHCGPRARMVWCMARTKFTWTNNRKEGGHTAIPLVRRFPNCAPRIPRNLLPIPSRSVYAFLSWLLWSLLSSN